MSRLIDMDKMLKRIESWNTSDAMDKALYNFTLNRIVEQPTVDAIPFEWIAEWVTMHDEFSWSRMLHDWKAKRKEE